MIKTILVPATGSDADAAVFASALAVARRFDAHLDFLHVRVDAATIATSMASDGAGGAAMVGGLVEQLDRGGQPPRRAGPAAFRRVLRARGAGDRRDPSRPIRAPPRPAPRRNGRSRIGAEAYWVAEHGRATDLMVVGRPADGQGVMPETIEAALLDSGRPVLIPRAAPLAVSARNYRYCLEGDARGRPCSNRRAAVSGNRQRNRGPDRRRRSWTCRAKRGAS